MSLDIDTKIIEAAAQGDAAAFGEIYFSLRGSIYGFVYRMLGERAAAEDITQETFIFFIENPQKYRRERGSLFSFLCGVARNRVMHHLRKYGNNLEISRDETDDFIEPKDEIGRDPLKILLDGELAEKIEEGAMRLSPLQREVLLLREMQEFSYEEIAKITEVEVGVVKARLYRARRNLARLLVAYLAVKKENCYELY